VSTSKISTLFTILNKAKDLGSYRIANLAFSCLIDLALDLEKELHFIWEKSQGNDEEDIYYDLLVISDGIRSVCIPAPILKKPLVFRSLCKEEEDKEEHNRSIKEWILEVHFEEEIGAMFQQILGIFPNALELREKYLEPQEYNTENEKVVFQKKLEIAKNTTFARVEATGKIRPIYISPQLEYSSFADIPWDSYHIGGSTNNPQWIVKSDGNPQWIWYFVHSQQLPTLKKGESRWLIGKGCDSSSDYEVWVIADPKAIPKPVKVENIDPDPDTFWVSTTLDEYEPSNNYHYQDTGKIVKAYGGNTFAIKFCDISKTSDILQYFPSNTKDPYYNRWLVFNRIAKCYDMLRPAQH
jgi:hypothetical protein